jgi:cation diffusion facilitator family transporter
MSHRKYGRDNYPSILICLLDGPRTLPEIGEQFRGFIQRLGFFPPIHDGRSDPPDHFALELSEQVGQLVELGWITRRDEQYALTDLGQAEADKALSEIRRTVSWARRMMQPETVPQVAVGVHLALAALKLPAALLSGSVGLLNDAADTLLDGMASLLVFAGMRFDKERAVNVALVLLMLGTGCVTLYEAIRRFFDPFKPEVDGFTFAAALVSALVCAGLWTYQRYVGARSGSVTLITQSVDSRNHVIAAAGVVAGLIASLLEFGLLDTLVGLAVALFILKSAVELAIESFRSLAQPAEDLARPTLGLVEKFEQFRQNQLRDWMLYLVERHKTLTRTELIAQARKALDHSDNRLLGELGLDCEPRADEIVERSLADLFERSWLQGQERVVITAEGKRRLQGRMRRRRRGYGWERKDRACELSLDAKEVDQCRN